MNKIYNNYDVKCIYTYYGIFIDNKLKLGCGYVNHLWNSVQKIPRDTLFPIVIYVAVSSK